MGGNGGPHTRIHECEIRESNLLLPVVPLGVPGISDPKCTLARVQSHATRRQPSRGLIDATLYLADPHEFSYGIRNTGFCYCFCSQCRSPLRPFSARSPTCVTNSSRNSSLISLYRGLSIDVFLYLGPKETILIAVEVIFDYLTQRTRRRLWIPCIHVCSRVQSAIHYSSSNIVVTIRGITVKSQPEIARLFELMCFPVLINLRPSQ